MPQPLILTKSNGIYSIPLLEEFRLRAVFVTRKYDNGRIPKITGLSRRNVAYASQRHGTSVLVVDERYIKRSKGTLVQADALLTDRRHLALAIFTADCLPIFMFDVEKRVIAMVHAGWRGLSKGIISCVVRALSERFSTRPSDLLVAFGPAIRPCCYEVGRDFLKIFKSGIYRRRSRLYLDLSQVAAGQLIKQGILQDYIYDSRICTCCMGSQFFSYRREGARASRFMSALEIKL